MSSDNVYIIHYNTSANHDLGRGNAFMVRTLEQQVPTLNIHVGAFYGPTVSYQDLQAELVAMRGFVGRTIVYLEGPMYKPYGRPVICSSVCDRSREWRGFNDEVLRSGISIRDIVRMLEQSFARQLVVVMNPFTDSGAPNDLENSGSGYEYATAIAGCSPHLDIHAICVAPLGKDSAPTGAASMAREALERAFAADLFGPVVNACEAAADELRKHGLTTTVVGSRSGRGETLLPARLSSAPTT
ncbi:MAG: hypothetical protein KDD44_00105 [Bdellovibrionales bacterium]|nr:hypothetical protein [Bdellovibrionales bacterium]